MRGELCLRFLFYNVVFIVCQKTGNFVSIYFLGLKKKELGPISKI